jgi:serine protease Do
MSVNNLIRNPIATALLGAAAVAVPAGTLYLYGSTPHAAETVSAPASAVSGPAAAATTATTAVRAGLPDFRGLVEQYGPSVVNISVRANVRTAAQMPSMPGFGPDDPFSQFFRGIPTPQGEVPMHGEGSGFIVSPDGLILTNAHVVADAEKVTVKLLDRREFEAKVLGSDAKSDIAVLKIDATKLPAVRLGRPESLRVGEWVVAIGAPFGFDNSVTAGIVSAMGRSLPDDGYVPFIQTDVAVNPGNSGGPLFNLDGEVVGINSQIYSRSGGYQGVSFAIPIDMAMDVSRQLQASGHVTRGRLGVGIQDMDQALAESFGLEAPRGALVSSVEDDGPADRAGIKAGDVVVSFNGHPVDTAGALPALVGASTPGKTVPIEIWRGNSTRKLDVQLDEMKGAASVAANVGDDAQSGRLGLRVRPLSADEKREIDVDNGLVVEGVAGAAEEAGIRPGDLVLSANGKSVHSVDELKSVVTGAKDHVALLVQRGDSRLFVPVDLG